MTAATELAPGTVPAPAGPRVLAITGFGVLSGAGIGPRALAAAINEQHAEPADVSGMFEEQLPGSHAHALVDFKVRDHLGRKGTSFFDRSTALSMVACKEALSDTDLDINDDNRARIGITLGTTAGSAKSTSDYSRDTFVQDRPYLVNPLLFPNAVMNCAAGQAGIWYGLQGANATIAGGPLAMLNVLRYSRNLIGCGYADALLVGSVEEFSPQSAWAVHYAQSTEGGNLPPGEGAAVFVVEDAVAVRAAGRRIDAEVLAVEVGVFDPPGPDDTFTRGLATCLARALERAGVTTDQVTTVATAANGMSRLDDAEEAAITSVLGAEVPRLRVKEATGEAFSASGAFQLAALLARHRAEPARDGEISVITTRSADGAAGAAVVRGWSRDGGDNG
ncbi:beta-ketoacyl synthase N-terminal-like domain-containing protein [Streptomyces sp. H10-C2]|uniref:beta-ketoacyl synthase N-terminal-like domain-containing protein n=1 Tax=unclassified Streptomyces TaxID=2593676 RepID=UPI0024BB0E55|nr:MULTISPECIES: beta-ketoacyl synthase N-terminal-like domain-containing protein [unclassified Streptomyces]MDJ0346538.1 beta-ketoacyl synthase N-terminal-like domain-containing protein [Streptomyces sp. PH10-H1]MDJ0374343.1 beta-ketoacyl synthase N-terminal-like domain-containing protein [Streptomyces sp. H10-C2]